MDDFSRVVIEQIIRSKVGKIDRVETWAKDLDTPLGVFWDVAEQNLDRQVDLYWINQGLPGHFVIPSDKNLAVVFHTRQLEISTRMRGLYTTEMIHDRYSDITERFCLKFIAELFLHHGKIDQALQTFAKSRLGNSVLFFEPKMNWDLEYMPIDEQYMVIWFYGLGHEIGHSLRGTLREDMIKMGNLSEEWISSMIRECIRVLYKNPGDQNKLKEIIRRYEEHSQANCYASVKAVQEEALADLFGFWSVCKASRQVFERTGKNDVDAQSLLIEIILAMNSLMIAENCKILTSWFTNTYETMENQHLALSNVALTVRINLLLYAIRNCHMFPEISTASDIQFVFKSVDWDSLFMALQAIDVQSREMRTGIDRVQDFLTSTEFRNTDIFYSYVESMHNDPIAIIEAKPFVLLAKQLGKHSPELELLAQAARI